jgi:hypothetical protein
VQQINDWIVPSRINGVTRWQVNRNITVGRITFQITFQRSAMDLDALYLAVLGSASLSEDSAWTNRERDQPNQLFRHP